MPLTLHPEDVDELLVGLTLLGSGGGGDAGMLAEQLKQATSAGGIPLLSPAELGDPMVVAVGTIGATGVITEKLPAGNEIRGAVEAVAKWTGHRPEAMMPIEAAALSGAMVIVASLELNLPILDADLMGRALPRVDQLSWAVAGRSISPFAICEANGQLAVIEGASPFALERAARAYVSRSGGWAGVATSPVPASQILSDSCVGTLARALRLGRAHSAIPSKTAARDVAMILGGHAFGAGRVVDVARYGSNGFGRGSFTLLDEDGTVVRVESENEYLLAIRDGAPVASCPDLLVVLDRRTMLPIAVDAMRPNDDVLCLVLPSPEWWRKDETRLARVGPRAFGLSTDPVLLETGEEAKG